MFGGFKMPGFMSGGQGSPMSQMNNQQKLQALGAAFGGDQDQLSRIMGSLEGGQPGHATRHAPIKNDEGDDISAAFGGGGGGGGAMGLLSGSGSQFGLLGPMLMKGGGMGLLGGLLGGLGKKKGG